MVDVSDVTIVLWLDKKKTADIISHKYQEGT